MNGAQVRVEKGSAGLWGRGAGDRPRRFQKGGGHVR